MSQTEVQFGCRALCLGQKIHVARPEGLAAEQGDRRYFTRQQLTLRYWIDCNPALGQRHIRLNTAPPIAFPYANESERDWLLQVLNDFIQKAGRLGPDRRNIFENPHATAGL